MKYEQTKFAKFMLNRIYQIENYNKGLMNDIFVHEETLSMDKSPLN